MADMKFSALTQATDLTSAEVHVLQGGSNKRAPIALFGGTSLTQSAQTITTADVTGEVSTHYLCTIAGLTADRNLTLPTATAGDKIRVTILDGDDAFGLVIVGAATVTINGGSAATAWRTLSVAGQSVEFEATSATNWQTVSVSGQPAISTKTASNSATVDLLLPAEHDRHEIIITGLVPQTDTTTLSLQFSTDGGSTWVTSASYRWANHYSLSNATAANAGSNGDTKVVLHGAVGNDTGEAVHAVIDIWTANKETYTRVGGKITSSHSSGFETSIRATGALLVASVVNAVQFSMSSGNIASGKFTLTSAPS